MPEPIPGQFNEAEKQVEIPLDFFDPIQTIDMLINNQKEGLVSGFNQEISHENLMPLSPFLKSIENLSDQASYAELQQLQASFNSAVAPLLSGSQMVEVNSVNDLEIVLRQIYSISQSLEDLLKKYEERVKIDETLANDPANKFNIQRSISASHASCVENLLVALNGLESDRRVPIASAMINQINRMIEGVAVDPALLGSDEIVLLSSLTGIDMTEGSTSQQREQSHGLIETGLKNSEGQGLHYLESQGFKVHIDIPEDLSISENFLRNIVAKHIIPRVLNLAIKESINEKATQRLDGFLKIAYDGNSQNLLFNFPVKSEHVVALESQQSRRPEMPKPTDKKESAWGPFFRRLVFDRYHREYIEPIIPEIAKDDHGQAVATVRLPYVG